MTYITGNMDKSSLSGSELLGVVMIYLEKRRMTNAQKALVLALGET